MVAALGQHRFDPIFFPDIAFAQELDLHPAFRCQPFGIVAQRVAKRLGELGIVEDPDLALIQIRGHALGKTDFRQRAEQQSPVPAGKHPGDLRRVTFRQQRQAHSGMSVESGWVRLWGPGEFHPTCPTRSSALPTFKRSSRAWGPGAVRGGERPHWTSEAESNWRELADWSARYPEAYARGARGTHGPSICPVLFWVVLSR